MEKFIINLKRQIIFAIDTFGERLNKKFYIYSALIFTILAIIDFFSFNLITGMKNSSFDTMVKYRFKVTPPSKDILILDIDEKTLTLMAQEFGRWPWPRQVFGEFVEKVQNQNPKAIVFDILFSDPDIYNSESDAYFNEIISQNKNIWFPMVRLPQTADKESQLKVSNVPGARISSKPDTNATIALIMPFFEAAQKSKRMGFNTIQPDSDGVCREYPIVYHEYGYKLNSLPLSVAQHVNPSCKSLDKILINWRGKPFTYNRLSFVDVYNDLRKEHPSQYLNKFKNKIIIIGSTAPSLYDIKVTAVDRQFPGVEILATAIDNLLHSDWLKLPNIPIIYLLCTLLILWTTAFGFYHQGTSSKFDQFYGSSQIILIAIAYSAMNFFNTYINLTGPVMFGFVFYSISRYYAFATARALDKSMVKSVKNEAESYGFLLAIRFNYPIKEEKLLYRLSQLLMKRWAVKPSVEQISGRQLGFWRLFENTIILCWRVDKNDAKCINNIRNEIQSLKDFLPEILKKHAMQDVLPFQKMSINFAEGRIENGNDENWQALLGDVLVKDRKGNHVGYEISK